MSRCDFRTEMECSCSDGQCRVQLIYAEKPRPVPFDARPYQYLAVVLFGFMAVLVGITHGLPEQKRLDLVVKESGR